MTTRTVSGCCCCICIPQAQVGVLEKCGRFDRILLPGFNFVNWCFGECVSGAVSMKIQQLDIKCETKTKDNVFVNIVISVQYRAIEDKATDAFYKLSNPKQQIQAFVFDVVRASVPKLDIDAVFEQKDDIAQSVKKELDKVMGTFGYYIQQTLIVDIEPDALVKRSMNEINAAARLRLAANEKGEADKVIQVKRAEAEAESKYLSGCGIARQRQAIVDGLRESVLTFSSQVEGTSAKDVMDLVLITQYFDTMKDIGSNSKSTALFIPSNPSAVADIATQIRSGFLQGNIAMAPLLQTMDQHQHHHHGGASTSKND